MTLVDELPTDPAIEEELRTALAAKIVDKSLAKWRVKMRNIDGEEVEVPDSLNGEIFLETDEVDGKVRGWITISVEDLARLVKWWRAGNPVDPTWRKKLDEWKAEGIDLGV